MPSTTAIPGRRNRAEWASSLARSSPERLVFAAVGDDEAERIGEQHLVRHFLAEAVDDVCCPAFSLLFLLVPKRVRDLLELDVGAVRGLALDPGAYPAAGDFVMFGTGPSSTDTSTHMGIVAQVWPDGAVVTVEGDAGPAANGRMAVIINGPYLPAYSAEYNGEPIYAYIQP